MELKLALPYFDSVQSPTSSSPSTSPSSPAISYENFSVPETDKDKFLSIVRVGREETIRSVGLADRLKIAIAQVHEEVMIPKIVGKLAKGELPVELYTSYLEKLLLVYSALEESLLLHSSNDFLSNIFNHKVLSRVRGLENDIQYFTREYLSSDDQVRAQEDKEEGVRDYVKRLRELGAESGNTTLLLAHSYARYLGDLSGGQHISKAIKKNYKIGNETEEGIGFYSFYNDELGSSITGIELKDLKSWFKNGLDKAGELMSEEEIYSVLEETQYAFKLNLQLFEAFESRMSALESQENIETREGEENDQLWKIIQQDERVNKGLIDTVEALPTRKEGLVTLAAVGIAGVLAAILFARHIL